ncbi:MAG TPA: hypothetical protein VMV27_10345 [Candidatus Binataceae bacterium]|nr:hypothetical protein [Candidatus Binataceae bacterium]
MNGSARAKVIPLREGSIVDEEVSASRSRLWNAGHADDPRPFPTVSTLPRLPVAIPDEILDYYGWVFCQGGFLNLQMTFEQFLAVVAAVSPSGLCPEYDPSDFARVSD